MSDALAPPPQPIKSEGEILHMTEVFLIALCLFREARSQGADGMQLVYDVISNRAADPRPDWPNSRMAVVLQPAQFSCFNFKDGQSAIFPQPKTTAEWLAWIQAVRIAERGVVRMPGINHYHRKGAQPAWSRGKTVVLARGEHLFYAF